MRINMITCIYGRGTFFSGQKVASELLIAGLRERGWQVKVITTPLLDRVGEHGQGKVMQFLGLGGRLLLAWWRGMRAVFGAGVVYVSLGQTKFALVRDGFPLLVKSVSGGNGRIVVSLNGSLFMAWNDDSLEARLLRRIVQAVRYVTVVGQNQMRQLVQLGIPEKKIVLMDNTCVLTPLTEQACTWKQREVGDRPIHILFLSNLIETKGYPEFVEAIAHLAQTASFPIEAILCGQIMAMNDDTRFANRDRARVWVEEQLARINQSLRVKLRWVHGACGQAKQQLFQESHIFILPSRYKVEAQPITVLEALATGCVVITTKVGEIPTTVSEETAMLLDDSTPESIAEAIITLQRDTHTRKKMALNGLRLFQERFSHHQHLNRWEKLLQKLSQ